MPCSFEAARHGSCQAKRLLVTFTQNQCDSHAIIGVPFHQENRSPSVQIRRCHFCVALALHTCGCVQQPRLTLAPPPGVSACLGISGGIRWYGMIAPIVSRSARAEPQTLGAVLSGRFVPAMLGPCRPRPASQPESPLRQLFPGRGLGHDPGSCRAPCKLPNLPCRPLPSPPFGGVRAVRARVTFACSSMASWVGLPYFGSCLACFGSESRLDPEPWRGANA